MWFESDLVSQCTTCVPTQGNRIVEQCFMKLLKFSGILQNIGHVVTLFDCPTCWLH